MSHPDRRPLEMDYSSDARFLPSLTGGAPLNNDSGDDHRVTDSGDDDLDDDSTEIDINLSGCNEGDDLDEDPVNQYTPPPQDDPTPVNGIGLPSLESVQA